MKKKLLLIVLLFSMLVIPVKAADHISGELIPKSEEVNISTEIFDYQGLTFTDDGTTGNINIKGVLNKTSKQLPMSINLLLFDVNRVNIGFVSYCTDKDFESNYSGAKVNSNSTKPLGIKVSKKYFVTDKKASDVAYYSLLDANQYCQTGGYEKYAGLTIEEILNGKTHVEEEEKEMTPLDLAIAFIKANLKLIIGVIVLVVVISLVVKIIKKSKATKMVDNKVSKPVVKEEPERIRKNVEKEELEEEKENKPNTFINLGYENNETNEIQNDSSLLTEDIPKQEEQPQDEQVDLGPHPEESNSLPKPEGEIPQIESNNQPSSSNDGESELMDLFK